MCRILRVFLIFKRLFGMGLKHMALFKSVFLNALAFQGHPYMPYPRILAFNIRVCVDICKVYIVCGGPWARRCRAARRRPP